MTQTSELALSELSNGAQLVQIYNDNKFSTAIYGDKLFLLSTTIPKEENIIAFFDAKDNCTIVNRDKTNVFVDYSHEHFGQKGEIDELPEEQIKKYLLNFLAVDLLKLIQFKSQVDGDLLSKVLNLVQEPFKTKAIKGFNTLGVLKTPYTRAYTLNQIQRCTDKKYYYAVFDITSKKFEMTNSDFSKVIKNGGVGSWKSLLENPNAYIFFFNKTDNVNVYSEDLELQLSLDLQTTPYKAANKFIKLEDQFTKAINETIAVITQKRGFVDITLAHYPVVDHYAEAISKGVRSYQMSKDDTKKQEVLSSLKEAYFAAYQELQKSQDSLKKLYELAEGIQ